jgi:hypothetical protein
LEKQEGLNDSFNPNAFGLQLAAGGWRMATGS